MKSIFDLGVGEAYQILVDRFGIHDLPPLQAIEFEDWGRDLVLGRFLELPADELERAGFFIDGASSGGTGNEGEPRSTEGS